MLVCATLESLGPQGGASPAQTSRLRVLQRSEACVHSPATWPLAVLGRYLHKTAYVDEEQLEARAHAFLDQIVTHLGGAQEKSTPKDVFNPEALRLAVSAGFKPYLGITRHYDHLKLSRDDGRKALEFLEAHGYGRGHRISSGSRGGQLTLLEVTDSGWNQLEERQFARPPRVCKGGFPHEPVALALGELGRRGQHTVFFERAYDSTYADVTWETRDGRLIVYQIGMSSPQWEEKSLRRLLNYAGIAELHLICRDKAFLRKVAAQLQGQLSAEQESRLQLGLLAMCSCRCRHETRNAVIKRGLHASAVLQTDR